MALFISQVTPSSNFETIPPLSPTVPTSSFYVGLLRIFRFVCLKRSKTASWFLTTPPVCCLPSASSIDSLGYSGTKLHLAGGTAVGSEQSSHWVISLYGVSHPVAVPWVLELISLFLLSGLSGFWHKFRSSLVGY